MGRKNKESVTLKKIEIENDLLEWLQTAYPGAAITWVVNGLLRAFKDSHAMSPQDIMIVAAQDFQDKASEQ